MAVERERPERFAGHTYPQIIPKPDEIKAGRVAPWSSLRAASRMGLTLDVVAAAFRHSGRLLGENAQLDPSKKSSLGPLDSPANPRSAVLVALFEENGETEVILTRRASTLRHHQGEIALPGGRSDDGESPTQTALREAHEEVGLDPSAVTPVGWLSPTAAFAISSVIWPIVGFLSERPQLRIDPVEVSRVFTVSLKDLVADGAFLEERWRRVAQRPGIDDEGFYTIYFYRVPGDVIWGATARILTELLSVVTGVPSPQDGGHGSEAL